MDKILSSLKDKKILTGAGLDRVRQFLSNGDNFLQSLLASGELSEGQLLRHFADELQCPYFETLDGCCSSKELLSKFSPRILLERHIAPIQLDGQAIY
ncbi:MAG: hypothetical protein KAJ07_05110, partial [Planctomycetes bacterium]|nr:hypothetical protein [Planctomycetota bacterium]